MRDRAGANVPNCDLQLILDASGPHAAGQAVTGHLVVRADGDVQVDGSTVSLAFETRGKGARHRSPELTSKGGPFDLKDGEAREVPFSIDLPAEPVTFSGEIVGVVWLLGATVDVPWAFDPKADVEIEVVGPARAAPGGEAPEARLPAPKSAKPAAPRGTGFRHAPYLLLALVAVVLIARFTNDEALPSASHGIYQLVFAAVFGAYLVWRLAGRSLLNRYAARGLGEPSIRVRSDAVVRGEIVEVEATIAPPGTVELEAVEARLVCRETAHAGTGRDRRSHEHAVVTDDSRMSDEAVIAGPSPRVFAGKLQVPEAAIPTFEAPNNYVAWEVEVAIRTRGGVEHVTRLPVRVAA